MWIDEKNRVRRYETSTDVPVPENASGVPEGGKLRTSVVAEYYDFGSPVNVKTPQDQTTDGSKPSSQRPVAQ